MEEDFGTLRKEILADEIFAEEKVETGNLRKNKDRVAEQTCDLVLRILLFCY